MRFMQNKRQKEISMLSIKLKNYYQKINHFKNISLQNNEMEGRFLKVLRHTQRG